MIHEYLKIMIHIYNDIGWGLPIGLTAVLTWIQVILTAQTGQWLYAWLTDSIQSRHNIVIRWTMVHIFKFKYDVNEYSPLQHNNPYISPYGNRSDGSIAVFVIGAVALLLPILLQILIAMGILPIYVAVVVALCYLTRYVIRLTKTVKSHIDNFKIHNKDKS